MNFTLWTDKQKNEKNKHCMFNKRTFAYYVDGDKLGVIGVEFVIGKEEIPIEVASKGAGIVVGDIEDEDWAVLHVHGIFTAVPG